MKTGSPSVVVADFQCAVCGARLDRLHLEPGPEHSLICSFCGAPQPDGNGHLSRNGGPNGSSHLSLVQASDVLREERERRGESLEDVAVVTGINQRYLEDLECGDASFEPYPGRVYGRFFLREYAEHLGLDPDPMVEAFDGEAGPIQPLEPTAIVVETPRRSFPWSLAALIGVVLLLIGAAAVRQLEDDPTMPGSAVSAASTRPELKPPFASRRPPDQQPSTLPGIRAVVRVSSPCWIEATSNGNTTFRRTAEAGTVVRLRANRRLELTLGNPGGVDLIVNGQRRSTGPPSEVAHLVFVLRGNEVRSTLV
ncbi:MAG TPA: RodZ domain-containing protein [Actinomycetota bacterium]|nr:RodZ domain-containing protein [Actinomycetota bacterium]